MNLDHTRRARASFTVSSSKAAFASLALVLASACANNASAPEPTLGASDQQLVEQIRQAATPITGTTTDYDPLMRLVGDARVVLLGESTHGTHEFYRERARISQRLITEKGFSAIAVEGDWPDAYRVNRYVRGIGQDATAEQALSSFTRFPHWMWRNEEMRDLVRWLRTYNDGRPAADRVGFYGLDVYSMYESIDEVLAYLGQTDPTAAARARTLYGCFTPWRPDPQGYGAATRTGTTCTAQAADVVAEMTRRSATRPTDPVAAEALFAALRNAHSVANAERYFRTTYTGQMSTWNIRDQEMANTVGALEDHLRASTGRDARLVVWAHNTHTGDARVTEPGEAGEHNIGQLMRQKHGAAAVLVGFHTYTGTVFAASEWGATGRQQSVRVALPESYGALFHAARVPNFLLPLRNAGPYATALSDPPRLERAIGVIYAPGTERQSHYFSARLGQQFDAVVFFDTTRAVTPLR
jgi:erythromycin esterase-like protein